jgi:hypothetical protein
MWISSEICSTKYVVLLCKAMNIIDSFWYSLLFQLNRFMMFFFLFFVFMPLFLGTLEIKFYPCLKRLSVQFTFGFCWIPLVPFSKSFEIRSRCIPFLIDIFFYFFVMLNWSIKTFPHFKIRWNSQPYIVLYYTLITLGVRNL